ncbi:DUF4365 domain-containing protein [Haliangium sp.]|uniref:DUF4365 domain-containing protein n=1 Tax=Haliangium sp. TaxID=2663208 RepID=UPI003D0EBC5D
MRPLSENDIEAELSYAYLYAVASRAGMACSVAGRYEDNAGIDAKLTAWGPFPDGGYLQEVDIKIQLKATVARPADDGRYLSYFLKGVGRYDDLRTETQAIPRILVVLFLPEVSEQWLSLTHEQLILRRCAYWVSLRGAPAADTSSGVTVKLPKAQMFDPAALTHLAVLCSRREFPRYEEAQ